MHAARAAKINRSTHYRWLEDLEYADAFDEAKEEAVDVLEMEARRRAVEGIDRPVFYQGKKVGSVRSYSDTLLIFLLKGAMPEKYRERHELSGGERPVQFAGYDPAKLAHLTDEQLEQLESTLRVLAAAPED